MSNNIVKIEDYTELGNAKRFITIAGDEYLWIKDEQMWFKWNGTRWIKDDGDSVYQEIESILDSLVAETEPLYQQIEQLKDNPDASVKDSSVYNEIKDLENRTKTIMSWHKKSQSAAVIRNTFSLARSRQGMSELLKNFDSKGHYLGVKNGVIDLRSGELIVEDKKFLMMKSATLNYDSSATCEQWEELLNMYTLGRKEYIDFLKVLFGSCLVGNKKKWFTFFHGNGSNGKTTLLTIVDKILGDYALVGDPKAVTESKSNQEYHLASYIGRRMVSFNETDRDEVNLAESLIKRSTDGDEITARNPAGRPFEYTPMFTPIYAVNHLPSVSMDPAVWRRVLVVPFEYKVKESAKVEGFEDKVIAKEGSGILNWLIEGAQQYLKEGLCPPESIKAVTQQFKDEMDILGTFLKSQCQLGVDYKVNANELRKAYITWNRDEGYNRQPAARRFSNELRELGLDVRVGSGNVNWVYGVKIGKCPVGINDENGKILKLMS